MVHAILYLLNRVCECRREFVAVVLCVFFDVKNAFNTASWALIVSGRGKGRKGFFLDSIKSYLPEDSGLVAYADNLVLYIQAC